ESDMRGVPRQLAEHCVLSQRKGDRLSLILAPENAHLNTDQVRGRLQKTLSEQLRARVRVDVTIGDTPSPTPAQLRAAG
ncbi:MAG: hypothetical protein OXF98_08430, partial [Rhodospirillaceae bacterium]|nr:hypothetical protein [Rhodospirillaceae bacterium]